MKKRGQTTTFIIVGLLLLITVGMLFYIRNLYIKATEVEIEEIKDQATTLPPLKSYVENCIYISSIKTLKEIGPYGGSFNITVNNFVRKMFRFQGSRYYSACTYMSSLGCVNHMLTREFLEREIALNITPKVKKCINLSVFEKIGYQVTAGVLTIDAIVAVDDVTIIANYPIRIEKVDDIQQGNVYYSSLKIPLGRLYDLFINITNEELTKGYFDKDKWMLSHGAQIKIYKYRPYPNIVYNLSIYQEFDNTTYDFLFGIEGRDTVKMIGQRINFTEDTGRDCYDYRDQNCFINAPNYLNCINFGLSTQGNCSGLTNFSAATFGVKPCIDEFGDFVQHGYTNCMIEKAVLANGTEKVGSRYVVRSCYNGEFFYEPCRDFREEYCTYDPKVNITAFEYIMDINDSNKTITYNVYGKAMCKPNRWHSCLEQTNQIDCLNDELRDCHWDNSQVGVKVRPLCVPHVSPGFRFWDWNGIQVCEHGNEYRTCDGLDLSCPQTWNNAVEARCTSLGDCGNNRNIRNTLTKAGYFSSDDRSYDLTHTEPPEYTRYPEYNFIEYTENNLRLNQSQVKQPLVTGDELENFEYKYSDVIDYVNEYIDEASSWDLCGDWAKCKFGLIPVGYVAYVPAVAVCTSWQAPWDFDEMNCSSCHDNEEIFPCSEYKCKSLGKGCNYDLDIDKNEGICSNNLTTDVKKFNMSFYRVSTHSNYNAYTDSIDVLSAMGYLGVEIQDPFAPNQHFTVEFFTSEETICTLSLIPPELAQFSYIQPIPLTSGVELDYTKHHKIPLTLPEFGDAFSGAKDGLNFTFFSDFMQIIDDFETFLNENPLLNDTFAENNVSDPVGQFTDVKNAMIIFYNFTQSFFHEQDPEMPNTVLTYFVVCQTRGGTVNNNPTQDWFTNALTFPNFDYFKLVVNQTYVDTSYPNITATEPNNYGEIESEMLDLVVYLNEPAECRISENWTIPFFNNVMDDSTIDLLQIWPMECSDGGIDILEGNVCKTTINTTMNVGDWKNYYIKCRDNPIKYEEFSFNLKLGGTTNIDSSDNSENHIYAHVNDSWVFLRNYRHVTFGKEFINDTNITYQAPFMQINISMGGASNCYWSDIEKYFWEKINGGNTLDCGNYSYCENNVKLTAPGFYDERYVYCINRNDIEPQNVMPDVYQLTISRIT